MKNDKLNQKKKDLKEKVESLETEKQTMDQGRVAQNAVYEQ